MDENASSSSVILPADASSPVQEPTAPETVIAEVVELPDRPFFETPFSEYTVTEGLLLLLVVLLVIRWIVGAVKEGFRWLLW